VTKRLVVALLLTLALVVGSGIGTADARTGPGFAPCRASAEALFRAELKAGVSGFAARAHRRNSIARCRRAFQAIH
jgi:hypothetical protein